MRRIIRPLVTLCSALSLMLLLLVCVLWGRSYWLSDRVDWRTGGFTRYAWTAQGHLVLGLSWVNLFGEQAENFKLSYFCDAPLRPFNYLFFTYPEPTDTNTIWEYGSFAWYQKRRASGAVNVIAIAPFWSVAVLSAVLPLGWATGMCGAVRARHRRRRQLGLCVACGYDLRASPGRCPECGGVDVTD